MPSIASRMLSAGGVGGALLAFATLLSPTLPHAVADESLQEIPAGDPRMLTQPYLQRPTADGAIVVWITNFPGSSHEVIFGEGSEQGRASATTERLERMHEDAGSRTRATDGLGLDEVALRPVWRHEAVITGLTPGQRVPYQVRSVAADSAELISDEYTVQPLPLQWQPLRILLTSDQQNRYGFPAAMEKLEEELGSMDAVFFAGDFVDVPRRASEWFDRYDPNWLNNLNPGGRPYPSTRPSFFPAMQGYYQEIFPEFPWNGGAVLQHAPLFGSIGNHESPGRYRPNATFMLNGSERTATLNSMDSDPQPRWFAEMRYEEVAATVNPGADPQVREQWIRDNSHDFEVHRNMWTLPEGPEGESYWAQQFGDVFVISMNMARIWRTWNTRSQDRGKFKEIDGESPAEWGFGDFHFYPFSPGSEQYNWLVGVLNSDAFQSSQYRVVMAHHTVAGLGDNAAPPHADNVMYVEYTDADGAPQTRVVDFPTDTAGRIDTYRNEVEPLLSSITRVRYEYPLDEDIWRFDIEPLLIDAGVQLVHLGHSHVWNRTFAPAAPTLNYLETSATGNTFGAFWTQADGTPWAGRQRGGNSGLFADDSPWDVSNYPRTGDPHGRPAVFPTLANPMQLFAGEADPVPFVSNNNISSFSVLDTGMGMVRSFALDLTDPEAELIEFDRFELVVQNDESTDIAAIIEFFDSTLESGATQGVANNPLTRQQKANDFRKHLERVASWNEQGRTRDECNWLEQALGRTDGMKNPSDLIEGPAAPILADVLSSYLAEICED